MMAGNNTALHTGFYRLNDSLLRFLAQLALVQFSIEAALGKQALMCTLLDYGALLHDENKIRIANG